MTTYLYVISTHNNENGYKIGYHTGDAKELRSRYITALPNLIIHLFYPHEDAKLIEKKIHKDNVHKRTIELTKTEWYKLPLHEVINMIMASVAKHNSMIHLSEECVADLSDMQSLKNPIRRIHVRDYNKKFTKCIVDHNERILYDIDNYDTTHTGLTANEFMLICDDIISSYKTDPTDYRVKFNDNVIEFYWRHPNNYDSLRQDINIHTKQKWDREYMRFLSDVKDLVKTSVKDCSLTSHIVANIIDDIISKLIDMYGAIADISIINDDMINDFAEDFVKKYDMNHKSIITNYYKFFNNAMEFINSGTIERMFLDTQKNIHTVFKELLSPYINMPPTNSNIVLPKTIQLGKNK